MGDRLKVAIFDFDGKQRDFESALDLCYKSNIVHGFSNYSFDLWLILHKIPFYRSVTSSAQYQVQLSQTYQLSSSNSKSTDSMNKILSQIALSDVRHAIDNGKLIDQINQNGRTSHKTSRSISYYLNPDLSIHHFVEQIFIETGIM
jgi:hypothetical protein